METQDRNELLQLLMTKSVCRGQFTLASGAQSDLYIDARLTTFDPGGAVLLGRVGWRLVKETAAQRQVQVDAIGGLTLGADPVALSIGIAARLDDPSSHIQVFTVRKEAKGHGRQKRIEGNFAEGNSVVVVDDVRQIAPRENGLSDTGHQPVAARVGLADEPLRDHRGDGPEDSNRCVGAHRPTDAEHCAEQQSGQAADQDCAFSSHRMNLPKQSASDHVSDFTNAEHSV